MSHKAVIEKLIPLDLAGIHQALLTAEGNALDQVAADLEALRQIIITDTVTNVPPSDDRIKMVPVRGDIKKPYYIALAAELGYTIEINDYTESQLGWTCCGDLHMEEPWVDFTAGVGMAGDTLGHGDIVLPYYWEVVVLAVPDVIPSPTLEEILNDLKPAHKTLNFIYP